MTPRHARQGAVQASMRLRRDHPRDRLRAAIVKRWGSLRRAAAAAGTSRQSLNNYLAGVCAVPISIALYVRHETGCMVAWPMDPVE